MSVLRRGGVPICSGPLYRNLFLFSVPIILSGMLQMLFNAADTAVVGRFGSPTAMASVGATASLTHLLVNVFLGMSTGACVAVAQSIGADDRQEVRRTVRTSVLLSLLCGVTVALIGIVFAPLFLRWMGTPDDVLPGAALYMRLYFAGMPAIMLYNFGSSVLRSMGDTRRPMLFLIAAGVVNVLMNLLFVIVLRMDVAGVALATVLSQCGAAALVVRCLQHLPEDVRLDLRRLAIDRRALLRIMRIGLPAGLQSSLFSFSNVILQSSINSLGSVAVSAHAAVANIESLIYIAMNSVAQGVTTFAGQNYGARQLRRVSRTAVDGVLMSSVFGMAMGLGAILFSHEVLSAFTRDETVIRVATERMFISSSTYFLCGLMEVVSGTLRGMGRSVFPMTVTLVGVCGVRILWVYLVFPLDRTLFTLFMSYPLSWFVTGLVHILTLMIALRKEKRYNVRADLSGLPAASV